MSEQEQQGHDEWQTAGEKKKGKSNNVNSVSSGRQQTHASGHSVSNRQHPQDQRRQNRPNNSAGNTKPPQQHTQIPKAHANDAASAAQKKKEATNEESATIPKEPTQMKPKEVVSSIVSSWNDEQLDIFPKKPKEKCTLGKNVELYTNHYLFKIAKPFRAFGYNITIVNLKTKREVRDKETVKLALQKIIELQQKLKNKVASDYKNVVYSLEEVSETLLNNGFQFSVGGSSDLPPTHEAIIKPLTFKETNSNSLDIDSSQPVLGLTAITILHLFFTHNLRNDSFCVGRSFFSFAQVQKNCIKENLGFYVDLWKGFFVSVRPSELGLNVNIDVTYGAFLRDGIFLEMALDFFRCNNEQQLAKAILSSQRAKFIDLITNCKVKTTYNGHLKKIWGLGPPASKNDPNLNMSVAKYFDTTYNIKLKHPDLPCLQLAKDRPIYVPMELCVLERKIERKLDPMAQGQMVRATTVPVGERKRFIHDVVQNSEIAHDPTLSQLGISLSLTMTQVSGKVLPHPGIDYENGGILAEAIKQSVSRNGKWDNRGRRFFSANRVQNWVVVNCIDPKLGQNIKQIIDRLQFVAKGHGILMQDPILQDAPREAKSFIENLFKKSPNLELVVVFIEKSSPVYAHIKTLGDLNYGIATQCISETIFEKQQNSIDQLLSNLCLKINPKKGGRNFFLSAASKANVKADLTRLFDGDTMVFGADVNHQANKSSHEPNESIATVVGSVDAEFCHYATRCYAQVHPKGGQSLEVIHNIGDMVYDLLQVYFEKRKKFPKRLIFYRDGVSEGQFALIKRYEMNKIREACLRIQFKPAVTYIVVQKRHHTRFFPVNSTDAVGRSGNAPPGTMVDAGVITPDMFDFFLLSHYGIQGTSRPCHYHVLHDENEFSFNKISLFSFYLCHVFNRSTGPISYPAPTYYADLMAARGRVYDRTPLKGKIGDIISKEIKAHSNLRDLMFFI